MFLTGNLKTVSEPRATVPKSCSVSANILVTQASARHWLDVSTNVNSAPKINVRMEAKPPEPRIDL